MTLQVNTHKDVFRITSLYWGIYSRVARKLGVTPSVVRRVALDQTKSKRISKALAAELRRVERTAGKVA